MLIFKIVDTPLLALTGTADKGTTEAIISSLGLKKDRMELFVSPNIINIRISVVKTKKDAAFTQLHWISDMIREQRLHVPKKRRTKNTPLVLWEMIIINLR